MANYRELIPWIKKWEGGLSKDPVDRASADSSPSGYHTNKGVTWTTFKSFAPRLGYSVSQELFLQMPDSLWDSIWKAGYWNLVYGDHIKSQSIADAMAAWAWNSGPGRAVKEMQRSLNAVGQNVKVDGAMGPETLKAINNADERALFEDYFNRMRSFYKNLAATNPSQNRFLKGWLKRVEDLYNKKKVLSGAQPSV